MQDRNELLSSISDLSKAAYGFRVRMDYDAMSDADLERTYDEFLKAAEDTNIHECMISVKAQKAWEVRINQFVLDFNVSRATAIRWDMQAYDADEVGYYCYLNGLAYELEDRIQLEKGN